jgi:hypothetical protein
MRWVGHVASMGGGKKRGFWWKPRMEETNMGRRRRLGDTVKIELREIGWSGMDWILLAQDRDQWRPLVNTVRNLWVP